MYCVSASFISTEWVLDEWIVRTGHPPASRPPTAWCVGLTVLGVIGLPDTDMTTTKTARKRWILARILACQHPGYTCTSVSLSRLFYNNKTFLGVKRMAKIKLKFNFPTETCRQRTYDMFILYDLSVITTIAERRITVFADWPPSVTYVSPAPIRWTAGTQRTN